MKCVVSIYGHCPNSFRPSPLSCGTVDHFFEPYFSFVFSSVYAGLFKSRNKYDIIIVSSPPLFVAITAYILSLVKRVPFIFEIRDLWPESAIDTGILQNKLIIKFAYFFESYI